MIDIGFHEVGEIFKWDGVLLEVVEVKKVVEDGCEGCYLKGWCDEVKCTTCIDIEREDYKSVIYKLVKKCKQKDMKQKTEFKVEGTGDTFVTCVGNIQSDEEIYGSLLEKLFSMYKSNITDYGSEFAEMFDELGIDYAYGKLREKMKRIKVLRDMSNIERLEDALLDMAGYAILTLVELKKRNNGRD